MRRSSQFLGISKNRVATIGGHCSDETPLGVSEAPVRMCLVCGWEYHEDKGDPDHGIPPGTKWEDIPKVSANWSCPDCGALRSDFEEVPQ